MAVLLAFGALSLQSNQVEEEDGRRVNFSDLKTQTVKRVDGAPDIE